jgi:hypothetical protein
MKLVSFLAILVATTALGSFGCAVESQEQETRPTGRAAQALTTVQEGTLTIADDGDGDTEQTREHILLARQVGVPSVEEEPTRTDTTESTDSSSTTTLTATPTDETDGASAGKKWWDMKTNTGG